MDFIVLCLVRPHSTTFGRGAARSITYFRISLSVIPINEMSLSWKRKGLRGGSALLKLIVFSMTSESVLIGDDGQSDLIVLVDIEY